MVAGRPKKYAEGTRQFSLSIDQALISDLTAYSLKQNVGKSDVIDQALRKFLFLESNPTSQLTKQKKELETKNIRIQELQEALDKEISEKAQLQLQIRSKEATLEVETASKEAARKDLAILEEKISKYSDLQIRKAKISIMLKIREGMPEIERKILLLNALKEKALAEAR